MSDQEFPVPDDLPATVPGALERAARRFPELEALVDGDLRLTYPKLLAEVDRAARALVGSGVQPGDRVAIWAPNCAEWAITASAVHRAGAAVVPLNTRFKGAEARYILDTAGARMLFTVTDFLDTDYVGPARRPGARSRPSSRWWCCGAPPRRAPSRGRTSWPGADGVDPDAAAERAAAIGPDDICDILFTSGTTGAPKGAMLRHSRQRAGLLGLVQRRGPRRGRPLPDRQPLLPLLRAQGRHPRQLPQGSHDRPPRGLRRPDGDATRRRGAHHDAPRAADRLPDDARPPRARPLRPVHAAAVGHRGGDRPGRDDPSHALRAHLPHHRHRLRAHRGHRHRHHVPPRRRPRDHRQHRRAGHPRRRGARSSTTTARRSPPASRARWSCAATS